MPRRWFAHTVRRRRRNSLLPAAALRDLRGGVRPCRGCSPCEDRPAVGAPQASEGAPTSARAPAGPHRPPGSSLRFRGQDRSPINIRFPLAPICHFSPGRVWVKQTAGLRTDESLTKVSVHCFHTYVILTSGDRNSGGDACPESRRGGEAQWRAGASSWAPAPTVAIWDPAVVTAAEGAVFEGRQELPGADRPEHLLLLPT